jgi:hypothetical protein
MIDRMAHDPDPGSFLGFLNVPTNRLKYKEVKVTVPAPFLGCLVSPTTRAATTCIAWERNITNPLAHKGALWFGILCKQATTITRTPHTLKGADTWPLKHASSIRPQERKHPDTGSCLIWPLTVRVLHSFCAMRDHALFEAS